MDRNSLIGFGLIFILFFIWLQINAPSEEEMKRREFVADSIRQAQQLDSLAKVKLDTASTADQPSPTIALPTDDSTRNVVLQQRYGAFAASAEGEAKTVVLENELIKVTFSTQGGWIKEVLVKDYLKGDTVGQEEKMPLVLLEDEKNSFSFSLPGLR